jgi:hypothetical protein
MLGCSAMVTYPLAGGDAPYCPAARIHARTACGAALLVGFYRFQTITAIPPSRQRRFPPPVEELDAVESLATRTRNAEKTIYVPEFGFATHRRFADLLCFWHASGLE